MNNWYPRHCPNCGDLAAGCDAAMAHHIDTGHEPPPFCAACSCMVDSGGDGPDGCACLGEATLQNPHQHRFAPAR